MNIKPVLHMHYNKEQLTRLRESVPKVVLIPAGQEHDKETSVSYWSVCEEEDLIVIMIKDTAGTITGREIKYLISNDLCEGAGSIVIFTDNIVYTTRMLNSERREVELKECPLTVRACYMDDSNVILLSTKWSIAYRYPLDATDTAVEHITLMLNEYQE